MIASAWWRVSPLAALALLGVFLAITLVQGVEASGGSIHRQILGAFAVWAALPAVLAAIHIAPDGARGWGRFALVHAVGYAAFGTVQTCLMLGFDVVASPWLGRAFDPSHVGAILRDELRGALLLYPALAGLAALVRSQRERALHATRQAALEHALVQARLDVLAARLDPHFLFNTLNTISVLMYEDLDRAETLVADLGSLLRAGLDRAGPTWDLADELSYARRYVAVLRARFDDRLDVTFAIDAAAEPWPVPRFSIQCLVENAVKHNAGRAGPLTIRVGIAARAGHLAVRVDDDGAGFGEADPLAAGRGLARLRDVLQLLYGARATLAVVAATGGGASIAWEVRQP